MKLEEIIEVLQAAKAGKAIQWTHKRIGMTWLDVLPDEDWNFGAKCYRVKPEPREFLLIKSTSCECGSKIDGQNGWHVYNTFVDPNGLGPTIRVREVIE